MFYNKKKYNIEIIFRIFKLNEFKIYIYILKMTTANKKT